MKYRRLTISVRYDDGQTRKAELLVARDDVRVFCGNQEIPRLAPGTSKSVYIPGATSLVAEEEFVFELDGKFLTVRPNGRFRPMVTAIDGLARFTFGKTEILTAVCIGALFLGLITLVFLL